MHFYKLIKSLQAFDAEQIKSLQKYVRSPYFGVYPPSVLMFDYMATLHPRFPQRKITFEAIANLGESLSTLKRQETAGTRLMRCIEGFIAQEEWQKNDREVTRYRIKGYMALGMETEFEKAFEKELVRLKEDPEQSFDVFAERHLLTELSFGGVKARIQKETLMPIVTTLDEFYAIKKVRYLCEAVNRNRYAGKAYEEKDVSSLFEILEPYNNLRHPYVYLFVNAYKMLHAKNYLESLPYYERIKNVADSQDGPKVSQSIREAMGYAVNTALSWFNLGDEEAGKEYLWWMEWRMKNNLLLENGRLFPVTFRNMMVLAVGNKDAKWMEETISFYGSYLPEEHRDANVAFAKGIAHFASGNYKKAGRFFLQAQAGEEAFVNAVIKRWQWMCSYEYDRTDADILISQLAAFEKHLQRNKNDIGQMCRVFELFVEHSKNLILSATKLEVKTAHARLEKDVYFMGKKWLLQKFGEKMKSRALSARDF